MTNKEWLDYLAHNAPDELAAWFDAERITNQAEMLHMPESRESATMQQIGQVIEDTVKRVVHSDTEPENADSREQLEAGIRDTVPEWHVDTIIGWLDRQAAITERETKLRELYKFEENHREHIRSLEEVNQKLNERIAELTAERDNWEANCEDWKKDCERYRSKFGKCLDYADAIHALMDDEGMA